MKRLIPNPDGETAAYHSHVPPLLTGRQLMRAQFMLEHMDRVRLNAVIRNVGASERPMAPFALIAHRAKEAVASRWLAEARFRRIGALAGG